MLRELDFCSPPPKCFIVLGEIEFVGGGRGTRMTKCLMYLLTIQLWYIAPWLMASFVLLSLIFVSFWGSVNI